MAEVHCWQLLAAYACCIASNGLGFADRSGCSNNKKPMCFLGCRMRLQADVQVNLISQRCELIEMISLDVPLMALCFAKTE